MDHAKIRQYREGLGFLEDGLFLNYAATAPLTQTVISEIQSATEQMKKPLGQYFYQALNQLEFARRQIGELIHASPKELAFTQNTSTAISTIALSIAWKPGDKVLVAANEFPSNYYPWVNLKNQGVLCETFQPLPNVSILETLQKRDLKNVRLISLSAVSYETGRLHEIEALASFCRDRGILSCIDAIQAIGAVPFDLKALDVDFMATGAQKWLMGPVGCGLIYAKAQHLESLHVPYVGWTSLKYPEYMELGPLEFSPEMTRFEPGLPNYLSIVGLAHSLKELKAVGMDTIFAKVRANTLHVQKNLRAMGLQLLTEAQDQTAGITSFRLPKGYDPRKAHEAYAHRKVFITARGDYVRVAPHFFNEVPELEHFLEVTEDLMKVYRPQKISFETSGLLGAASVPVSTLSANEKVLITGASGGLAPEVARAFLTRGMSVHLLGRTQESVKAIANTLSVEFPKTKITYDAADFSSATELAGLFARLSEPSQVSTFSALVNCASVADAGLFHEESIETARKALQVNVLAPIELMHLFLKSLKSEKALGILNIVSSTGRCGSPLLATYSASHAAIWTFSETLSREWADTGLTITTYVAPAMHSPLQKRLGRVALRYFKMSGTFDYEVPDKVAAEAVDCLFKKKSYYLSPASRVKILMNSWIPELVSSKIKKAWRDGTGSEK
jgi:selenocysteine lyase/cysteine desulfurase/short-subunit dehydrogenase